MPIIPVSEPAQQPPHWQTLLSQAITDPRELLETLGLPVTLLPDALRASETFRLRVPRGFVARMRRHDPADPLLRQVLPLGEEGIVAHGYSADPLQEGAAMPVPGLLHKYAGRVLLTTTGACAVHCRYCFRRHYPYADANPVREPGRTLAYLENATSIREVILSGGDPLTLSDARLAALSASLGAVPHIRRLRIHTRVPVVLPERIDRAFLEWLQATRLQVVVVIHSNHPNEIDAAVQQALLRLKATGATLLNQSVLLKGVNDDAADLAALSERLFDAGVLPYYLHQLDRVQGAAHFSVPDESAKFIIKQMIDSLPGYLVPRLVRESAGELGKTPL